jgi:hypothetical protein
VLALVGIRVHRLIGADFITLVPIRVRLSIEWCRRSRDISQFLEGAAMNRSTNNNCADRAPHVYCSVECERSGARIKAVIVTSPAAPTIIATGTQVPYWWVSTVAISGESPPAIAALNW